MVFTITIEGYGGRCRDGFTMIVHRKAILNLVSVHLLDVATAPTVIPWDIWGPPVTRWFNTELDSIEAAPQTSMHSYGQRYVTLGAFRAIYEEVEEDGEEDEEEDDEEEDDSIIIYDFNPWQVRDVRSRKEHIRACQSAVIDHEVEVVGGVGGGSGSEGYEAEQSSNVCFSNGVFKLDIVGRLPYVQYKCLMGREYYDTIMIDEERVIGVQASAPVLLDDSGLTAVLDQVDQELWNITSMDAFCLG
jgi:hypothetical protein